MDVAERRGVECKEESRREGGEGIGRRKGKNARVVERVSLEN
jgi:hypothetical protein